MKGAKMNGSRWAVTASMAFLTTAVIIGTGTSGTSQAQMHDHSQHSQPAARPRTVAVSPSRPVTANSSAGTTAAETALAIMCSQHLPSLQNSIKSIIGQIESGNQQAALLELKRVQSTLENLRTAFERQMKPAFVNTNCPIMGTPIQATNVPPSLIRTLDGQKVAFCCPGCPAAWDRLSPAEKVAKLTAVTHEPKPEHAGVTQ
jgi:hypothetical protein